jgi:hypothetical protein
MNEIRALTNLVGNAVAALVVARWEGEIDLVTARLVLNGGDVAAEEPEVGEGLQPLPAPLVLPPQVAAWN